MFSLSNKNYLPEFSFFIFLIEIMQRLLIFLLWIGQEVTGNETGNWMLVKIKRQILEKSCWQYI